jgi:hypothetical protein
MNGAGRRARAVHARTIALQSNPIREVVVDKDDTLRQPGPTGAHLSACDAFISCVRALQDAFDRLGARIRALDPYGTEEAAREAVLIWLASMAALRRAEPSDRRDRRASANHALRTNLRALSDLLLRAVDRMPVLFPVVSELRDSVQLSVSVSSEADPPSSMSWVGEASTKRRRE